MDNKLDAATYNEEIQELETEIATKYDDNTIRKISSYTKNIFDHISFLYSNRLSTGYYTINSV